MKLAILGLRELKQAPDKCAELLLEGIDSGESPICLIGHADQTKLVEEKEDLLPTNETLGLSEGSSVKTAL